MKQVFIIILLVSTLSSCVSYKRSRYEDKTVELNYPLPKLSVEIDTNSIAKAFNQSTCFKIEKTTSKENKECLDELSRYSTSAINAKNEYLFISNYEYIRPNMNWRYQYHPLVVDYCTPYSIDNFLAKNEDKLSDEIIKDIKALTVTYSDSTTIHNKKVIIEKTYTEIYDLRIGDQLAYLNYIGNHKICKHDSPIKGTIKFEIIDLKLSTGWGWYIPSVLTLHTINLIGFPISSHKVELSVKCTIINNNTQEIYTKIVSSKGTSYSAMFWGYFMGGAGVKDFQGDIQRSANIKALSKATNLIIEDIKNNQKEILVSLE